jgi:hypothetical protein
MKPRLSCSLKALRIRRAAREVLAAIGGEAVQFTSQRAIVFYPPRRRDDVQAAIRRLVESGTFEVPRGIANGLCHSPTWCRLIYRQQATVELWEQEMPEAEVMPSPEGTRLWVPVEHEPGRFWVQSGSRADVLHLVDADYDGDWGCSCEAWMYRSRECAHIRLIKAEAGYSPRTHLRSNYYGG